MKYVPSASPRSYTATMLGWLSPAAAEASRRKRSTNAWSAANRSASTFTATSRSSTVSYARYTVAMPPLPIWWPSS